MIADIATLRARRADELRRLITALQHHADLARRFELVLSVPGIGERTALALILRMRNWARSAANRRRRRRRRPVRPAERPLDRRDPHRRWPQPVTPFALRRRLPAAFRWNAALKALYRRLVDRGKPHAVALVACARKLLIFANTVVARGTPWTEKPTTP